MARHPQLPLNFRSWGGKRKGAGRKPTGTRLGALHRARPDHKSRFPVLAHWSLLPHVWNLRAGRCFRVIRRTFRAGCDRGDAFRLVHFSVQGNHLHLLVEAHDKRALANGLRALGIRVARALNAVMGRRGRVLARYVARALGSPREARDALVYIFHNEKKHALQYGKPLPRGYVDPCTSAAWFDGWKEKLPPPPPSVPAVVAAPRTWLLKVGWRRHGLISVDEMPRVAAAVGHGPPPEEGAPAAPGRVEPEGHEPRLLTRRGDSGPLARASNKRGTGPPPADPSASRAPRRGAARNP